jgi:hypothetical protein
MEIDMTDTSFKESKIAYCPGSWCYRSRSSFSGRLFANSAFALATTLVTANSAFAAADSPTVTLATGGNGVPIVIGTFTNFDALGYDETEYFLSGNAHYYTTTDRKLSSDGKWNSITPAPDTAPYETRAVVLTPKDKGKFNGTVYVEWNNVSGQSDDSPDWTHGHVQVAREGAAYVLASAQAVGIKTLKAANPWWVPKVPYPVSDPARYAPLSHPGDSYSYDIYSQIGQAVWDGHLLGGLVPKRVIAVGESQSAGRLTTYIDAVQKLVNVYDGFIVHSSAASGTPLSQRPQKQVATGQTSIRDDLVPVLLFESEVDVAASQLMDRQTESANGKFRLWEVAGTAHYDTYGLTIGWTDTGDGQAEVQALADLQNPLTDPVPGLMECSHGVNDGPMHWVFGAAVHWINAWVKDGTPPPIAPRLQATSKPGRQVVYAKDANGNTLGGIRTPFVDTPVATLVGPGADNGRAPGAPWPSIFCSIFGETLPFTADQLASLYPSHQAFASQFQSSATNAVQSQFLLQPDATNLINAANASSIGGP